MKEKVRSLACQSTKMDITVTDPAESLPQTNFLSGGYFYLPGLYGRERWGLNGGNTTENCISEKSCVKTDYRLERSYK